MAHQNLATLASMVDAKRGAQTVAPGTVKNLLFLSHCVPTPPDKGEKIRAYHEIRQLASRYSIHLACFGRSAAEVDEAQQLAGCCASVYAEEIGRAALMGAAGRFAFGWSVNEAFYHSRKMKRYVERLATQVQMDAAVAFSVVMAPYAPPQTPMLLDMIDVDSEKWLDYARSRRPAALFNLEARRLRQLEIRWSRAARLVAFTTGSEERLFQSFAPGVATCHVENGIDSTFFDGAAHRLPPDLSGRQFVVFVGTMDYHPNIQAARWFAEAVLPELRRQSREIEFYIVGRNPPAALLKLNGNGGVRVTGGVPDIRPYLASARAIVVPLRLARGIQNKVLEALAMGREVFATPEVVRTFGSVPPTGVVCCDSAQAFVDRLLVRCSAQPECDPNIRAEACRRFSWNRAGALFAEHLEKLVSAVPAGSSA